MNWNDNASKFIGQIGQRLKNIEVVLETKHSFYTITTGKHSYFYQFRKGNDALVWWTDVLITSDVSSKMIISGTIKDHKIYYGENKTVLSRVNIREVL
jgi:hypothetical protein